MPLQRDWQLILQLLDRLHLEHESVLDIDHPLTVNLVALFLSHYEAWQKPDAINSSFTSIALSIDSAGGTTLPLGVFAADEEEEASPEIERTREDVSSSAVKCKCDERLRFLLQVDALLIVLLPMSPLRSGSLVVRVTDAIKSGDNIIILKRNTKHKSHQLKQHKTQKSTAETAFKHTVNFLSTFGISQT